MKHYGDITKINGNDVPIVDIVCGGSPCQDLSVAGKRAGLDGERSGLFMEQIRIIKEMREHDKSNRGADVDIRLLRPRFMVWENVPGAFSSNKGEDFRCVLEETARIVDKNAIIPRLEGKQKWTPSGCILGNGWSIAWRVHDAQFWGVPQRRKRIALVADFGGYAAPEILFEREGLSGDSQQGEQERKEIAGNTRESINPSSYTLKIRGGVEVDSKGKKAGKGALNTVEHHAVAVKEEKKEQEPILLESNQNHATIQTDGISTALPASMGMGGGYVPIIVEKEPVCVGNGQMCNITMQPIANSLDTMHDQQAVLVQGVDAYNLATSEETAKTLTSGRNDTHNIPCVTYSQDAYDKYTQTESSSTLKQSGGNFGGGQRIDNCAIGALCARDYKGVGNQYVSEGKVIVQDVQKKESSAE